MKYSHLFSRTIALLFFVSAIGCSGASDASLSTSETESNSSANTTELEADSQQSDEATDDTAIIADASSDRIRTERVQFAPGTTSTHVADSIVGYEIVDYVLNARAGQYANISMATDNLSNYFNILEPGETSVAIFNSSSASGGNQFEGVLAENGHYTIRVYMVRAAARRDEVANYRLEMIAADIPSSSESVSPETDLLTYNGPSQSIPVSAHYPSTMEVFGTGSGEGVGVFFRFKPQGNALDEAEISVFLPAGGSSTNDLIPRITGPNGLIENNGWYLDGSRADTASEFPYPWFEMVFDISTDFEQSGHILIGQANGQAIQVIVLYPAEMYDEFWSAGRTVLDSLEFDASLLPIPAPQY